MLDNFIGGGQVFLHKIRMLSQVFFRNLSVALFCSLCLVVSLNYPKIKRVDWLGFYSYQKASWAMSLDNSIGDVRQASQLYSERVTYINAKSAIGSWQNITPRAAMNIRSLRAANIAGWELIYYLLSYILIASCLIFALIFFVWQRIGRKLTKEQQREDSDKILNVTKARSILKSLRQASDLHIGRLPLIKDAETRHFLITGATGSGKTNWLHNLLPQIVHKEQPAIVIDQTGEMIAKYYNAERGDVIFNPFDERSSSWDFWADCSNDEQIEQFAQVIMSFNRKISDSKSDPFWEKSATEILEAVIKYQRAIGDYSLDKLKSLLRETNISGLKEILKDSPAARYLASEHHVTANSILSVLTTNTKPLHYLSEISSERSFSLKSYFEGLEQGDSSWLFLATKPSSRNLTLPLLACLMELALAELMNLGINTKRRVWFVLDEMASLGMLPSLSQSMTEGRKYGVCLLAGLQSLNQLYEHYGHYAGSKIFGQFGTLCIFRNQEESILRMLSNMCGNSEVTRNQKNTSFGADTHRDGVSYSEQQVKKELVPASKIANLAVGECYLLTPLPRARLIKMQVPEVTIKDKNKGFIQKEGSIRARGDKVVIARGSDNLVKQDDSPQAMTAEAIEPQRIKDLDI